MPMASTDDEWEYEYDETETEDFYIPVDLSNVPSAQVSINLDRRPGHPTFLKSRLRALNAVRGQAPDMTTDGANAQETATMGEVQIVGLHTPNPLIMYNGQLLSCQWTSTIGTDMFFTKRDADAGDSDQPLRSLPAVNLLSLGTAKLVAKVGRLRPRDDLFDDDGDGQLETNGTSVANNDLTVPIAHSQVVSTKQQSATQSSQPNPTSFLARLNQAKAMRGETSRLVITQAPEGFRLVSEHANAAVSSVDEGSSQHPSDTMMGDT